MKRNSVSLAYCIVNECTCYDRIFSCESGSCLTLCFILAIKVQLALRAMGHIHKYLRLLYMYACPAYFKIFPEIFEQSRLLLPEMLWRVTCLIDVDPGHQHNGESKPDSRPTGLY